MHAVCKLRLYTDDNQLLTGHPRIFRPSAVTAQQDNNKTTHPNNAMSMQTTALPDLTSSRPSHHNVKSTRRNIRPLKPSVDQTIGQDNTHIVEAPANQLSVPTATVAASSQLELILAKLTELDAIKTHLNTIDTRLNLLQPPSIYSTTVAQHS